MNINEYLVKFKNTFIDPRAVFATEALSESEDPVNKDIIESIVGNIYSLEKSPCEIGADVFNDVEFFKCFTDKGSLTIFDKLNHCALQGSSQVLKKFFETPTYDVNTLVQRQSILQTIETKSLPNVDIFIQMKKHERDVIWIYEELDQNLKELYEMVYFKFCLFKPLNNNPHAITINNIYKIACSPMIGIISPILYIIIPYLIVLVKLKIKIPFKIYIKIILSTFLSGDIIGGGGSSYFRIVSYVFSIVFYFQGILNSFEISKTLYKISRHLVEKVNNIVSFLKDAQAINEMFWTDDIKHTFFQTDAIKNISEEKEYIDSLAIQPFSLYSNFGKQLHTYITLNKDIIKSILLKTYTIESMLSILKFKKELNISYVLYEDSKKPILDLVDSFHPCIDLEKVVKNDISLGSDKNAILTGPNAGGKSTFVKSLIINTLLGQTVGICVASKGIMNPFYIINSQINIPDCKGYESLFEAEMYRCKEKLDILKRCPEKHSLFIMDEIFNSTNPVEGIAGAYAIAKKISEYPNCILMFTTHYVYLTKLHKTGRFMNYKMNIGRTDGNITYPYKLIKGISKQYIALDLLAKNGFDSDIITEAISIKDKLIRPREDDHVPTGSMRDDHVPTGSTRDDHVPTGSTRDDHVPTGSTRDDHVPTGSTGDDHVPTGSTGIPRIDLDAVDEKKSEANRV